jgi:hypothetical protein
VKRKKSRLAAALSFWKLGRGQLAIAADRSLPLRRMAVKPRAGNLAASSSSRYNQGASWTKGKTRKRKEMKATLLSFVFNNFWESGLFNALRLIQIKKIAPFPTRVPGCRKVRPKTLRIPPAGQALVSVYSGFLDLSIDCCSPRARREDRQEEFRRSKSGANAKDRPKGGLSL